MSHDSLELYRKVSQGLLYEELIKRNINTDVKLIRK